jgi:hypothetical protein
MDAVRMLALPEHAVLVQQGQALTLRTRTRSWPVHTELHVLDIARQLDTLLVLHPLGVAAYPIAQCAVPDSDGVVQLMGGTTAGPAGPVRLIRGSCFTSAFVTAAGRLYLSGLTVLMNLEDPGDSYDGFVDVGGEAVVDVAIGYNAVYAVTHTGRLAACGCCVNPDSLLGTSLSHDTPKPVFVTEVRGEDGKLQPAPRFAKVSFQKVLADECSMSLVAIDRLQRPDVRHGGRGTRRVLDPGPRCHPGGLRCPAGWLCRAGRWDGVFIPAQLQSPATEWHMLRTDAMSRGGRRRPPPAAARCRCGRSVGGRITWIAVRETPPGRWGRCRSAATV